MASKIYSRPRAPSYDRPTSLEDYLPEARTLVEREHGRAALGPIKDGDRLLITTLPDQDELVQKAVTLALEEAGAEEVTFKQLTDFLDHDLSRYTAAGGWREAEMLTQHKASTALNNADLITGEISEALREYVANNPQYTGVYTDIGARAQKVDELGEKFYGNWLFNNWEEFISGVWTYPEELLKAIEKRAIQNLSKAKAVRITDPEGTHLELTMTEEEAARWQQGALVSGHLYLDTFGATILDEADPVIPLVDGVIAGTANHTGFFPRIELTFESGKLMAVEGGGEYGDRVRDFMNEYADIQWPGYPDTGFFWFVEAALGTLPKAYRRSSDLFENYWQYPNITERNRAGVFHFGFGSGDRTHPDPVEEYALEHDIPAGHIHVHNYFTTFEILRRDTNTWEKIVDKGRITAMDDPEIRALAAKFGDPDNLLQYDWVPPIPGINCEGEYFTDFAPDPTSYLKERLAAGESI